MSRPAVNIFWFRRDLRLEDNAGLYQALKTNDPVQPIFVFDRLILDGLPDKTDRRVQFIHQCLQALQVQLQQAGASLEVFHGFPELVFKQLLEKYNIRNVYANHDYEPYARQRDSDVKKLLQTSGADLITCKDQVIFDKDEVVNGQGKPYTIFTPYSKRWKMMLTQLSLRPHPCKGLYGHFFQQSTLPIPSLESLGFRTVVQSFPSLLPDRQIIAQYGQRRDFPALDATSHLGVHLRFGTISIRDLCKQAHVLNEVFLNELIWREFFQMIIWQFPRVGQGKAFKPAYDRIPWRRDEADFDKWSNGQTGYPIVDAGMRQLNETGYMHNRVRMIVASFLSKHLLIDWRWGEDYFATKLLDYDLAANNGGWQWAAGSGCDAAPYFRIFNPHLQTKRFDPGFQYIRCWVPEYAGLGYNKPMVDHAFARKRALDVYAKALSG